LVIRVRNAVYYTLVIINELSTLCQTRLLLRGMTVCWYIATQLLSHRNSR